MPYLKIQTNQIDLPESKTIALSETLCLTIEAILGVPKDRIYIEFSDAPRHMWGWNGATF